MNAEDVFGEIPFNYIDPSDYEQYGLDSNDDRLKRLKSRFIKDGVYELRKYKDFYVPIMIIPKGTLLFRGGPERIDDFCGIPNHKNEY